MANARKESGRWPWRPAAGRWLRVATLALGAAGVPGGPVACTPAPAPAPDQSERRGLRPGEWPGPLAHPMDGVIFQDNFDRGESSLWGNQRGDWAATDGVYNAQHPTNSPPDYSGLPFLMSDFVVDVDINKVGDGGLWLRSDEEGLSGVLLITGGMGWGPGGGGGGHSLYWLVMTKGKHGAGQGLVEAGWTPGVSNVHIRVAVEGDTYSCYLNGSTTPITTLTNTEFRSGRVGLYDWSSQTFDNFRLSVPPTLVARAPAPGICAGWENGDGSDLHSRGSAFVSAN